MKRIATLATTLLMLPVLAGCGGDSSPIEPERPDVTGTYTLTDLWFDPQGSLPDINLMARLEGPLPSLVLAANGQAQLVSRDPQTGLVAVAGATYTFTPANKVQFTFEAGSTLHAQTFLANAMQFTFVEPPRTLLFDATVPGGGISRAALLRLVPEWEDEQLFDPVPGDLTVVYRVGGGDS